MAANYVYRRPSLPRRRRFIPQTLAGSRIEWLRRLQRVQLRARRARRAQRARFVFGFAVQTFGSAHVLRSRRIIRRRQVQARHRATPLHGRGIEGFPKTLGRMLRAVARMRHLARMRLRRRPPQVETPEVPFFPHTPQTMKGRFYVPGVRRGKIEQVAD